MDNETTGGARLLQVEHAIRAHMAANGGQVPSARRLSRELGRNDDRSTRSDWDKLAAAGRVPARLTTGPAQRRPSAPGRWRGHNGKTNAGRQRELKDRRKTDPYLELLKLQLLISQLSAVLEHVNVQDYKLDEVGLWRINDIHDDLLFLAPWVDRTLGTVSGYLGDADLRARIAKLRNVDGRTEEEARGFIKLADSLERKLRNRLIRG
jgi:hypothetical protein